jgi:multiple antibiotic resistance protein
VDGRIFGEVLVTLFVIMDPPGSVPIFLALTGGMTAAQRARAAWQAVVLAGGVIVCFAVAGRQVLEYLGIGIPALQGAGGLLLLLVALELLTGRADDPDRQTTSNVALVPLGTPLLAGPGAIVATMLFVERAEAPADYVAIGVGVAIVLLLVWATLRYSWLIVKVLRRGGIEVLTRIAGLFLAAIAVQLVADAIGEFVAAYTGA